MFLTLCPPTVLYLQRSFTPFSCTLIRGCLMASFRLKVNFIQISRPPTNRKWVFPNASPCVCLCVLPACGFQFWVQMKGVWGTFLVPVPSHTASLWIGAITGHLRHVFRHGSQPIKALITLTLWTAPFTGPRTPTEEVLTQIRSEEFTK